MMQRLADLRSDRHEVVAPARKYMHRGYEFVFGELPDVQFVQGDDAFDVEDGVFHFVQRNGGWNALKEDERCAFHCIARRRVGGVDDISNAPLRTKKGTTHPKA